MKKLVTIFTIMLISIFIVSCESIDTLPTELLEKVEINLSEGDRLDHITSDFSLPSGLEDNKEITITWTSSDPVVILIENNMGKVTRQSADKSVTLTAKVTLGSNSKDITFDLIVIKLEDVITPDTTKPVITGAKDINYTIGDAEPSYLDGVSATDDVDGEVDVTVDTTNVNLDVEGVYNITYTAIDNAGNKEEVTVKVIVTSEDTTKPVITGAKDINYTIGDAEPSYLDGVSATDDVDGEVDVTVDTTNVNLDVEGVYNITYTAIDNAGNKEEVTVKVIVTSEDTTKPVITGAKDINYTIGDAEPSYLDGVSATDDVDGVVQVAVDASDVNLEVAGTYDVIYTATDLKGNVAEVVVQITVISDEVPVVGETVTFKYTGTDSGNMTTGNNAASVGLVESVFNVTTDSVGSYNNMIGLNKDGSVRLYADRTTGNGNTLTVATLGEQKISAITIVFGEGSNGVDGETSGLLKLGASEISLGLADLSSTTKTYTDLDITEFSLKNTTTGTKSGQIWIISIDITYGGTGSVTPGEDTVAPVISGAKDITYVIGSTAPNYLDGVSALDAVDGVVQVSVDASDVNLEVAGTYDVIYTATDLKGNVAEVVVQITVISDEVPVVGETVTFKYTGTDSGNMTTGNNAASVGLVESVFNVTTDSVGSYNNMIGLNKDGSVRLYADRTTGNGNTLTVATLGEQKISAITIVFGVGSNTVEGETSGLLKLGASEISLGLADLSSTTKTYTDLDITEFSLKNTTTGTKSGQIWIVSIEITYGGTGSVTPGEDTVAPVISGAKDITYVIGSTAPNYLDGVSALDAVDGVVQVSVDASDVNLEVAGTYDVIYTATDLKGNVAEVVVQITVTDGEEPISEQTITMKYTGTSTVNMTSGNNAASVGLLDSLFNVSSDSATQYNNLIGLNKDGSIRLYADKATGNGNTLTVQILGEQKISSITVVFGEGTNPVQGSSKVQLILGSQTVDLGLSDFQNSTKTYTNLDTKEFSIKNTSMGTDSSQVWIISIEITYGNSIPIEQSNVQADRNALSIPTTFIENGMATLSTLGAKGSTIVWTYTSATNTNNNLINLSTGAVTVPSEGQVEVSLTATLRNGEFSLTKQFIVKLGEGNPTTILSVRGETNQSFVKTVGVVTSVYTKGNQLFVFMEDQTAAILVRIPTSLNVTLKAGDEIEVRGTKLTENSNIYIGNIRGVKKLATKELSSLIITADKIANNPSKLVSIFGLMSTKYTNTQTNYVLHTNQGSFTIYVPQDLNQTEKLAIQDKLANLDPGLRVSVIAPVYKEGSNNYIFVTSASELTVDNTVDFNNVSAIILDNIVLPTIGTSTSSNLDLTVAGDLLFGATINWVSTNPAVLSNTGVITQGEDDVVVTLTYTVLFDGEVVDNKSFNITVNSISSFTGYYSALNGLSGNAFKSALTNMIKTMGTQSGSTSQVQTIDKYNGQNYNIYTGFGAYGNREHVVPASKLRAVGAKEDDLHNLRAAVVSVNSTRSNYPFTNAATGANWKLINGAFYPGEEHVGDVARIVLYITLRNNIKITEVGSYQMFLTWHEQDPVSDFEISRNEKIFGIQKSRNPFIDHPELVNVLFS